MGLADALGLAALSLGVMLALLFVLALIEERMFVAPLVEEDVAEGDVAPAFDLSNAA